MLETGLETMEAAGEDLSISWPRDGWSCGKSSCWVVETSVIAA